MMTAAAAIAMVVAFRLVDAWNFPGAMVLSDTLTPMSNLTMYVPISNYY